MELNQRSTSTEKCQELVSISILNFDLKINLIIISLLVALENVNDL